MRALWAMTWVELKLFVREPLTVLFVLVLPLVMLYVLNGVFDDQPDPSVWEGLPPIDFYTSAFVALAAATAGVLALPVHLAGYREQGVLRRFRASAVRPATLVSAHMAVTVFIATVGAILLTIMSAVVYDATLPQDWGGVIAAFAITAVSFAALGALLGFLLPTARAAQGGWGCCSSSSSSCSAALAHPRRSSLTPSPGSPRPYPPPTPPSCSEDRGRGPAGTGRRCCTCLRCS